MKKQIAIVTTLATALGLAACTPPADGEAEATPEEAVDEETATDGTMSGETDPAEAEGDGKTEGGVDADGNPVGN